MKLSEKIKKSAIKIGMESEDKGSALAELVRFMCDVHKLKESEAILDAVQKREAQQSTGVGMGVAVPHAKTQAVDKLYVCMGISRNGIDFDSVDDEKARIFFIIVSPRDVSGPHIKALAGISRLVKDGEFRKGLLECESAKDIIDRIWKAEKDY